MIQDSKDKKYMAVHVLEGDTVVVLNGVENGLVKIVEFREGKVIHAVDQVHASVWFRGYGGYQTEPILTAMGQDTSYYADGILDGIVVRLRTKNIAVKYRYEDRFRNYVVYEDKAGSILFFEGDADKKLASNMQKNVDGEMKVQYQYYLDTIIEQVEEGFENWVEEHMQLRDILEDEKVNGEFPDGWDRCLTDESANEFYKKKREVEKSFAQATGVYYEFRGGLILE